MNNNFQFKVQTQWHKGQFENPKTHTSIIQGKKEIITSAAKEFKGQPDKHNPEDLLLSALSSCHMMSYFYVCQQHDIEIIEYMDHATGLLELNADSSGGFKSAQLHPVVTISKNSQKDLAVKLHEKAHKLCFIANSVNFKVQIIPEIRW